MSKEVQYESYQENNAYIQAQVRKKMMLSVFASSFYMTVSITLVFLNRFLLSDPICKAGGLFVSWYQFIVTYIIIIIISSFGQNVPLLNLFPRLSYKREIMIKVIPVSVIYLLMIGLNNKCLEKVDVSGYQIVRSLTILFNILLSLLVLGQKTSFKCCCCCAGVTIGFYVGIEGEINLSILGAIYGVLSSFFLAAYSIASKYAIQELDNNEYLLLEYNTPAAIVLLFPLVYFSGEFNVLQERKPLKFWVCHTIAGIVGFAINLAVFLNIKYTTPLTHNLSGTVKASLQTILAYFLFSNENLTYKKSLGCAIIICFSGLYAYVKKKEIENSARDPKILTDADHNSDSEELVKKV